MRAHIWEHIWRAHIWEHTEGSTHMRGHRRAHIWEDIGEHMYESTSIWEHIYESTMGAHIREHCTDESTYMKAQEEHGIWEHKRSTHMRGPVFREHMYWASMRISRTHIWEHFKRSTHKSRTFREENVGSQDGERTLCASLRSWNATCTCHKSHFVWKFTGKMPHTSPTSSIKHRGLYSYCKNPSVWPHCLGNIYALDLNALHTVCIHTSRSGASRSAEVSSYKKCTAIGSHDKFCL